MEDHGSRPPTLERHHTSDLWAGVDALDGEARRVRLTRQSPINVWIAERLERTTKSDV